MALTQVAVVRPSEEDQGNAFYSGKGSRIQGRFDDKSSNTRGNDDNVCNVCIVFE